MTWVAWRQQRTLFLVFVAATAALIGWAVFTGVHQQDLWHQFHSAPCRGGFPARHGTFCDVLFRRATGSQVINNFLADFALSLPPVMGIVLGVTAIASELESKTVRLGWTQSRTRTEWLLTKVAVGLVSTVVVTIPLSLTFQWWVRAAQYGPRLRTLAYPIAGWMLIPYGVFAFTAAVLIGTLIRKAGWSVAVGLIVFGLVFGLAQRDVRAHLVPLRATNITFVEIAKGSVESSSFIGSAPGDAWIIFQGYRPVGSSAPPDSWATEVRLNTKVSNCMAKVQFAAPNSTPPNLERNCLHRLGLRDVQFYVSDSQFWGLQLREGGLYLAASALFLGASVLRIRRVTV